MKKGTQITALWKRKDKNGKTYLCGPLTQSTRLMIFQNLYKREGSKDPDYNVLLVESDRKDALPPKAGSE